MTDSRESLGRIVHEQRLALNAELEHPRGLLPWPERDPVQRELDMRIGAAVAAEARRDVQAELAAWRAFRGAACAALRMTESTFRAQGDPATAERYRAAREALEGPVKPAPAESAEPKDDDWLARTFRDARRDLEALPASARPVWCPPIGNEEENRDG